MFKSILIANRGEIACRIIRTARILGIKSVAVYSDADKNALHVDMASDSVMIGPAAPAESYLNIDAIMDAIEVSGADAVHPGYGFLAENADFSNICKENGFSFIGPTGDIINAMGDKAQAKKTMKEAGLPIIPGNEGVLDNVDETKALASEIGYPVMLKA